MFDLDPGFEDGDLTLCEFPFDPRYHSRDYEPTQAERDNMEELTRLITEDFIKQGLQEPTADSPVRDSHDQEPARDTATLVRSSNPELSNAVSSTEASAHDSHTTQPPFGDLSESVFDLGLNFDHADTALSDHHFGPCCFDTRPAHELTDIEEAARATCEAESRAIRANFPPETQTSHQERRERDDDNKDWPTFDLDGDTRVDTVVVSRSHNNRRDLEKLDADHEALLARSFDKEILRPFAQRSNQRCGLIASLDRAIARALRSDWTKRIIGFVAGVLTMLAWQWVYYGWRPWFWTRTPEEHEEWCGSSGLKRLMG